MLLSTIGQLSTSLNEQIKESESAEAPEPRHEEPQTPVSVSDVLVNSIVVPSQTG